MIPETPWEKVEGGNPVPQGTMIQVPFQVSHCLSYSPLWTGNNASGLITQNIQALVNANLLSRTARLHIFIKATALDPKDVPKGTVNYSDFHWNGFSLASQGPITLKAVVRNSNKTNIGWLSLPVIKIPTTKILFGKPVALPTTPYYELLLRHKKSQDPKNPVPNKWLPTPGVNWLYFRSSGAGFASNSYQTNVYAYLEFAARPPIQFIHGTAADWKAWTDGGETSHGITYQKVSDYMQGSYLGIWHYNISLFDAWKHNGNDSTNPEYQQMKFHFLGDPRGKNYKEKFSLGFVDSGQNGGTGGNGPIDASAEELKEFIPAILESFGWKHCVLVAHSKGGSDARALIGQLSKDKPPFVVDALFTLGTPHLGTPLADIAASLNGWGELAKSSGALPIEIERAIEGARILKTIKHNPDGDALKEQQCNARKNQYYSDNTSINLNGHFYSVAGEADVDQNKKIDLNEYKIMVGYIFLSSVITSGDFWRNMGTAQYRTLAKWKAVHEIGSGGGKSILLFPTKSWILNDLVTPMWSSVGPHAKVLRGNGNFENPFPPEKQTSIPGLIRWDQMTPGNHTMLKSDQVVAPILAQISQDFPIQAVLD
jgi:hypothetical protein